MLSSLDLYFLTKELQSLIHGRIDKIYQDSKRFLIRLRSASVGKQELFFLVPDTINLTVKKHSFPTSPPKYCMFLRKYLQGGIVVKVEQSSLERILFLHVKVKGEIKILVLEFFSKGNVILCDEDFKIMSALENQSWSTRTIRGGTKYELPPSPFNAITASKEEFIERLLVHGRDSLVKALAMDFSFGGLYSEEILAKAKLSKDLVKPTKKQAELVFDSFSKLIKTKLKPGIQKNPVPFKFLSLENEFVAFDSFSSALDDKYSLNLEKAEAIEAKKEPKHVTKWKLMIEQQNKRKEQLRKSSLEYQKVGEYLYENYQEYQSLFKEIERAKKKGWDSVKELLESKGYKVNLKEKKASVKL